MRVYMIVEDDQRKARAYREFARHYRSSDLEFRIMASARPAIETLMDPDERAEFDGVIADFALGGIRWDLDHTRTEVLGPDGKPYIVSTGLGVLDWIHSVDPDLPLWALTSDNAAHAPLYMAAAALWLDAKPLSLSRLTGPGTALSDRMCEELLNPRRYQQVNPSWERVFEASAAFAALLNSALTSVEAFDWIRALVSLGGLHRGLGPALEDSIRRVTGKNSLNVYSNTLSPAMATWQIHLEEVYQDFPDTRERQRWQHFDLDRLPRALSAWEDFNPFIDFLAAHSETREFFVAEDVRMALVKWRSRGEKP
ncbi:hypothetical protein [Mycobacterium sp. M26]|uniref:hypothetical protein n=1 Tax=Mycobacterium sp. M26 TaxID=1762962 RepID=UPI00073F9E46|nr:hypothetical protein [Mycobacterium sp. M26]